MKATPQIKNHLVGVGLAVLATLCWSTMFVSSRYLLGTPAKTGALEVLFFRFLIGAPVVFMLARQRGESLRIASAGQLFALIKSAFFLYLLMTLLLLLAQPYTNATTTALFVESGPAIIYIVWKMSTRRPTARAEFVAVLLGVIGCAMVLNIISAGGISYHPVSWFGDLLLLASAGSWVLGSVGTQKLMRAPNPFALTAWSQTLAGIMSLAVLMLYPAPLRLPDTFPAWSALALIGVVPTALGFSFWSLAMMRLPLWQLNLMQNLTPVFTIIGAWLLLNERLTGANLLGVALVISGLTVASLSHRSEPA